MDIAATFDPKTSVTSFMVNRSSVVAGGITEFSLPFSNTPVVTPQQGVTTLRVVAASVELATYDAGTVTIDIANLPIAYTAVVEQNKQRNGVTMAKIPVVFSDRDNPITSANTPVVQLLPGVQLLDTRVTASYDNIVPGGPSHDITVLNFMMVMQTDGSSQGNTGMFQM